MVQKQHHSQAQTFSKRSCLEIPSLSHFSHFLHQATLRRTRFVRSFATTLIVGNARRQCRQCKEPKFCGCRRSGGVRQLTGITATPMGHDETTRETILLEEKNGNGWTHPVFRRVLWKCQDARRSSLVMDHIYILSKTVAAVVVCSMYLQLPMIWLQPGQVTLLSGDSPQTDQKILNHDTAQSAFVEETKENDRPGWESKSKHHTLDYSNTPSDWHGHHGPM